MYALARHLGLPAAIAERDPTTETFSLPQTQEEFYFGHPYDRMDLLVHGVEEGIAPADLAPLVGLDADGVASAYDEVRARAHRDGVPARERAHHRHRRIEPPGRPLTCAASRASCTPIRRARSTSSTLRRMAGAIRHRGPDGYGIASGGGVGLVSTRLAIFDIPSGWQPMQGAHRDTVMVYNGEVFNHYELAQGARGPGRALPHDAATPRSCCACSTATAREALHRCNGQWGIAHLDRPSRTLTLMRDRFGVRPLHYATLPDGGIVFSSEVKGILASGLVEAVPDLEGIDEVFTFWAARPPRCAFKGIRLLPPGHLLVWRDGEIVEERPWWEPRYAVDAPEPAPEELGELLRDSVRLRLRADVPVGCYLSGGLDSSLTTALAVEQTDHQLRTFSLAFRDPLFDESAFQRQVAEELGTQHHVIEIGPEEITDAFQDVMRHLETPVIRSAGVPLYLLARSTREQGITVVATGEGADELYWGYDLFKEAKVRAFCARDPDAAWRASLFDRMYPYFALDRRAAAASPGAASSSTPARPAIRSSRTRRASPRRPASSRSTRATRARRLAGVDPLERLRDDLPEEFGAHERARARRLPRADDAARQPPAGRAGRPRRHGARHRGALPVPRPPRLRALRRDAPARQAGRAAREDRDPPRGRRGRAADRRRSARSSRTARPRPRRSSPTSPSGSTERLSPEAVRAVGIFDERAVAGLVRRCRAGRATGFRENMALMGVLSTQIWHEAFCAGGHALPRGDRRSRACTSASSYPYGWVAPPSPIGGWHFAPHHRPW